MGIFLVLWSIITGFFYRLDSAGNTCWRGSDGFHRNSRDRTKSVSDDMKEGATLSSMGEIETIYEGGWYHDSHRIRSS
jgi:hypothetical protein